MPLYAGPPVESGPYVSRYDLDLWYFFGANGMVAFVGADVPYRCETGDVSLDTWDVQTIENPSDIAIFMDKIKGDDVATYIYPETAVFDQFGLADHLAALCTTRAALGRLAGDSVRCQHQQHGCQNGQRQHQAFHVLTPHQRAFHGSIRC